MDTAGRKGYHSNDDPLVERIRRQTVRRVKKEQRKKTMWAIDGLAPGEVYIGAAMVWVISFVLVSIDAAIEEMWFLLTRTRGSAAKKEKKRKVKPPLTIRIQRIVLATGSSRGELTGGTYNFSIGWTLYFLAALVPLACLLYVGSVLIIHGF